MSDDRDDKAGASSGAAAPPPLPESTPPPAVPPAAVPPAAAPPPAVVAPPPGHAPLPGYTPQPRRGLNPGWIIGGVAALAVIVLGTLWYLGAFDRTPSGRPLGDPYGGLGDSNFGQAAAPPSARAPSGPEPASNGMPTLDWLAGSWGPRCPGSREDVVTFTGDGRFVARGGSGNWSIDGYDVVLYGNGREVRMRWFALGPNSARVTQNGSGETDYVSRCG